MVKFKKFRQTLRLRRPRRRNEMRLTWKHYAKVLKEKVKHSLISFLIVLTVLGLGSLLFFYIEHCHSPTEKIVESHEKAYENLCKEAEYIKRKLEQNNSSVINSSMSNSTSTNLNKTTYLMGHNKSDHRHLLAQYAIELCEDFKPKDYLRRCEISMPTLAEWFDFTASVAFTTGFGRVVPYSDLGKIVTIIYSIPSIALGMSLYLSAGHIVTAFTQTSVLLFYNEYLGRKLEKKTFSVHVMVVQTMLTLIVWIVFSFVSMYSSFTPINRFIDGLYFAFLTISTVGFGDFSYSSEQAFNTNFFVWVIHAVLFCIGTGAIASIIGSINELIANGNIKLPSCCRQNKQDILGLTEMLKQTKPSFLAINKDLVLGEPGGGLITSASNGTISTIVETELHDNSLQSDSTPSSTSTASEAVEGQSSDTNNNMKSNDETVFMGNCIRNNFANDDFKIVDNQPNVIMKSNHINDRNSLSDDNNIGSRGRTDIRNDNLQNEISTNSPNGSSINKQITDRHGVDNNGFVLENNEAFKQSAKDNKVFDQSDKDNKIFSQSELSVGSQNKRTSDSNNKGGETFHHRMEESETNTRKLSADHETKHNTRTNSIEEKFNKIKDKNRLHLRRTNNTIDQKIDQSNIHNDKLYHTSERTKPSKNRHKSLEVTVEGTNNGTNNGGISRSRSMSDSLRRTGYLQNDLC
uniref:Potassium channel domain-containing protein n=1 Tax=Clytia hemisphaerica TaxID=252671 RepID=A0A7M5WXW9_9CNID